MTSAPCDIPISAAIPVDETALPRANRLPPAGHLLVIGFSLSLLLVGLGKGRSLTAHEVFAAQPAREMLLGEGWVVPHFGGEPWMKKPPGMSWLIAGSIKLFGSESEAVVRLPSVLAAVLSAWLVAVLAARWFDPLIGVVAGIAHGCTVFVWMQARLAEADMTLCAAVTAAMVVFAIANIEPHAAQSHRARYGLSALYYLAISASFLLKLITGPAMILGGCVAFALLRGFRYRDWRPAKFLLNPLGILVLLVGVSAWPIIAWLSEPGIIDVWRQHLIERAQGGMGGRKHVLFYAYTSLWLLLPWTAFVVYGVIRGWHWRRLARGQFLICWVVPGAIMLQISLFKHKHYVLPLLAPFVLIGAVGLVRFLQSRPVLNARRGMIAGIAFAVVGTLAAFAVWRWLPDGGRAEPMIIGVLTLGVTLMLALDARLNLKWRLATLFSMAWICGAIFFTWIIPRHDSYVPYTTLAKRAANIVPAGEPIFLLGLGECQVSYYLPGTVRSTDWPERLATELEDETTHEVYFVSRSGHLDAASELLQVTRLDEADLRPGDLETQRLVLARGERKASGTASPSEGGE